MGAMQTNPVGKQSSECKAILNHLTSNKFGLYRNIHKKIMLQVLIGTPAMTFSTIFTALSDEFIMNSMTYHSRLR